MFYSVWNIADYPPTTASAAITHIDIGTGLGHFVVDMAQRYPDHRWIGVEHETKIARRAARRLERHSLHTTVDIIAADARMFLLECIAPRSLDHIWINFPDPWPKDRHQDRRHTNPWMLGLLCSRLKTGGMLHLATDVPDYMAEFSTRMVDFPLQHKAADHWQRSALPVQTKYERKWAGQGKSFAYGDWILTEPYNSGPRYQCNPQSAPDYRIDSAQPSLTVQDGNYIGKLFRVSAGDPDRQRFLLADAESGIESGGWIDFNTGEIKVKGKWCDWKRRLFDQFIAAAA